MAQYAMNNNWDRLKLYSNSTFHMHLLLQLCAFFDMPPNRAESLTFDLHNFVQCSEQWPLWAINDNEVCELLQSHSSFLMYYVISIIDYAIVTLNITTR